MIDWHRDSIGSWSTSSLETRIYEFYIINIDAADEQTAEEAKAPAAWYWRNLTEIHSGFSMRRFKL